jgi:hypothetical protein
MPGCPKAVPLLVGFVLKLVGSTESMCLGVSATFERAVCAAFAFMISIRLLAVIFLDYCRGRDYEFKMGASSALLPEWRRATEANRHAENDS